MINHHPHHRQFIGFFWILLYLLSKKEYSLVDFDLKITRSAFCTLKLINE